MGSLSLCFTDGPFRESTALRDNGWKANFTRSHGFGICLERLRKRRAMHVNRLASLAGVDPSYITLLERGRRPPPREAVLRRLIAGPLLTPNAEEQLTRGALDQLGLGQVKRVNGRTAALDLAKKPSFE